MDCPAPPPNRVGEFRFAKRAALVQKSEEFPARLKKLVDPLHHLIAAEIAEAVALIGDRIVIKKSFQSNGFNVQDSAKKIQDLKELSGEAKALPRLPGEQACLNGLLFLRQIP